MSDDMRGDGLYGPAEPGFAADTDWRPRDRMHEALPAAFDWCRLSSWLTRLGAVLWLHRADGDNLFPRARLCARSVLLLDHPALAAFADCVAVEPHSAVTVHGPREWLEFVDARSDCIARLYLLPDADYLAWDAMLGDCGIARIAPQAAPARWRAHTAFMRCALNRLRGPWRAHVVRFPLLRLPCLQVLGLRAPALVSELGCRIAATIADDERALLQSA